MATYGEEGPYPQHPPMGTEQQHTFVKVDPRMAVNVNGVSHPSIADASDYFNVSTKTIREWIEKGIIPHPPTIDYGTRELQVFPDEYLRSADAARKEYMKKKKSERPPKKGKDVKSL